MTRDLAPFYFFIIFLSSDLVYTTELHSGSGKIPCTLQYLIIIIIIIFIIFLSLAVGSGSSGIDPTAPPPVPYPPPVYQDPPM